MGYTTEFEGFFTVTPPLEGAHKALLDGICSTRRMAREMDPPHGVEGEFYVNGDEGNVLDNNRPPRTQPGLNCDWELSKEGDKLQWSGMEKFYGYAEWLRYIITSVIPEGTVSNGEVQFAGEDADDKGVIEIVKNRIRVFPHDGERLQPRANFEHICREFQSVVPHILESLEHYRNHHNWTLGLPLKVDDYISNVRDVATEHKCTLPQRERIIGKKGDVTRAVYFSVLLNPKMLEHDVQNVLSAYNNFFDIQDNPRLPKASTVREYYKADPRYIKTQYRCPWDTAWAFGNSWMWCRLLNNTEYLVKTPVLLPMI